MTVNERIIYSISVSKSNVFLRRDFKLMGSKSQVNRTILNLIRDGLIVRIGLGVYARAKRSVLSGKPIPAQPVSVLAPEVLQRLGIEVYPSKLTRDYNEDKTTQIPIGNVVNVGSRRIKRKLGFGAQEIKYEND